MAVRLVPGVNDLETTHSDLALEWNFPKNQDLKPSDLTAGSGKSVWWMCIKLHEWQAAPGTRSRGVGCPFCSNQRAWPGDNDLETKFPEIAREWDLEKNHPVKPANVVAKSNKKYWWSCSLGHSYLTKVASRTTRNTGCPLCSRHRVLGGFNDLGTTHPKLAEEWSKRNLHKAAEVSAGHNKKCWWICSKGHEFEQSPNSRSRGGNCPFCSHQRLLAGFNDLATINPKLAKLWDLQKNSAHPSSVMTGARLLVWWKCGEGHSWEAQLRHMKGGTCPYCSNKKLLMGFNDLLTRSPKLAREWHREKNHPKTPKTVLWTSRSIKYWWRCASKHEWEATLASRNLNNGCPVCSKQLIVQGVNDMATSHPEIAKSFHPSKNFGKSPNAIAAGSGKMFWWICEKGHEWRTTANSRFNGRGCPECAEYGFKPQRAALLYFIENQSLRARKIGITNVEDRATRLSRFAKKGWVEVFTIQSRNGFAIRALELEIISWIRNDLELPQFLTSSQMGTDGGWTETFSVDGPTNAKIVRRIRDQSRVVGL